MNPFRDFVRGLSPGLVLNAHTVKHLIVGDYAVSLMRSAIIKISILIIILIALCPAQTLKAAEPKLPIQPGLYVPEGVECPKSGEKPDASVSSYYNDEGLSLPHRRCKLLQVRHEGKVYYLTQRCLCKGEDFLTLDFTVIITSRTSFSILNTDWEQKRTGKKETLYHYCGNPTAP